MFAQLRVADCFYIGSCGFAKDQNEAMCYWDLAAEQGSGFAQGQLATAYQFGINGLQKDLTQAAKWWRRAA
jgi:TPR repeat protein